LFGLWAAPAGADTTLRLAEGVTITLPDWLHYAARLEDGTLARSTSDDKSLPSDAEMNDGKQGKRLLDSNFTLVESGSKPTSFGAKLGVFRDGDDPAEREQLAKKRQDTIQNLERFASGLDARFSKSFDGFERVSIASRKIDDRHTLIDYGFRARSGDEAGDSTTFRWITIFGPDGAFVMMIDYPAAKQSLWGDDVDKMVNSIAFDG
jgi:hypothetical protein